MAEKRDPLRKFERFILKLERWAMLLGLFSILLSGFANIILRELFKSGLSFADVLARYLTIWLGLLGASYAASTGEHISIDALSHFISPQKRSLLKSFIFAITALGSFTLAYFAFSTLKFYYLNPPQPVQFGEFQLPVWIWLSLFPLTFTLIGFRYSLLARETWLNRKKSAQQSPEKTEARTMKEVENSVPSSSEGESKSGLENNESDEK